MCNRFHQSEKAVLRVFERHGIIVPIDETWRAPGNIFPTGKATPRFGMVVRRQNEGNKPLIAEAMEWGFPTKVTGKSGARLDKFVTNARNLHSPFWKPALTHPAHRCLVPFTWFAEPHPDGGKGDDGLPKQIWFRLADDDVGMFAGLWRHTERGATFAFATTEPNATVQAWHPKAMPAILHQSEWASWLDDQSDRAVSLIRPYDGPMVTQIETPS